MADADGATRFQDLEQLEIVMESFVEATQRSMVLQLEVVYRLVTKQKLSVRFSTDSSIRIPSCSVHFMCSRCKVHTVAVSKCSHVHLLDVCSYSTNLSMGI